MYTIGDLLFDPVDAFVDAYIDERQMSLNFGLNVSGTGISVGYEEWRPRAQIEIFASVKPGDIVEWRNIGRREVRWIDKYDADGEMYGSLYLFEHNPVYLSTLIVDVEQEMFSIHWTAKTDLNWDEKYSNNLDLEIKENLFFKGIWCGRKPEDECLELVANFFSKEDFCFTRTPKGVSLLVPSG